MPSGNISGGIGVSVRQQVLDSVSPGRLRVLAAAVLAPPVLLALYFGSPYSDILILAASAVAAWEWARLCGGGRLSPAGWGIVATVVLAVATAVAGQYQVSAWIVVAGTMSVAVIAANRGEGQVAWMVGGAVYLSWCCVAFRWLRQEDILGMVGIFWLLFVVWATDIGAYFAGRTFGGPKLAPRFSPNKTWSGLAGGALAAALVGALVQLLWVQSHSLMLMMGTSAAIAVVAQCGDLLESSLKRRFGAKDSGNLIPGHGGLLDRIDGLLAASIAVAAILWLGARTSEM